MKTREGHSTHVSHSNRVYKKVMQHARNHTTSDHVLHNMSNISEGGILDDAEKEYAMTVSRTVKKRLKVLMHKKLFAEDDVSKWDAALRQYYDSNSDDLFELVLLSVNVQDCAENPKPQHQLVSEIEDVLIERGVLKQRHSHEVNDILLERGCFQGLVIRLVTDIDATFDMRQNDIRSMKRRMLEEKKQTIEDLARQIKVARGRLRTKEIMTNELGTECDENIVVHESVL